MRFSQIWDAAFKALMIWIGVVFLWLLCLEARFSSQGFSVALMNFVGAALAIGFFLRSRSRVLAEKRAAEKEIAALLQEVG